MLSALDVAPKSIIFSTEDVPVQSRLDVWNAAFGSLNSISLSSFAAGPAPTVHCENWLLGGGIVLSQTRVTGARFARDAVRSRRDQLDQWVLRVLRHGRCRVQQSTFEADVGPAELVLFSLHETWQIDWLDSEWVSLCIPRDLDLQLTQALAAVSPGPVRGVGAGLLADFILSLPQRIITARQDELPALTNAVRFTIGGCLQAVTRRTMPEHGANSAHSWAKERVRRAILNSVGSEALKPEQLAASAGLSRSALYRIFEAEGGVVRYIRRIRLSLAHAALRDPQQSHRSIAAIAEAYGFSDASDFARAFRAAYGLAPRDVRGSLASPPILPLDPAVADVWRSNRDLVARIYAAPVFA